MAAGGGVPGAAHFLVLLLPLAVAGRALRRGGRAHGMAALPGRRAAAAASLLALCLGLPIACGGEATPDEPPASAAAAPTVAAGPIARLGVLRDLRWALAAGASAGEVARHYERLPPEGLAPVIADLWMAEVALAQGDLTRAEAVLGAVAEPPPIPLGKLLQGRLALRRGDAAGAFSHYSAGLAAIGDPEGLHMEAAEAPLGLTRASEAQVTYERLAKAGSRQAAVYYALARFEAAGGPGGSRATGEEYLQNGWHLEPLLREELFSDPFLAFLAADPGFFPTVAPSSPTEPHVEALVESGRRARRPVAVPATARASFNGGLLRIEMGGRTELWVPGGAALAPPGARPVSAGIWAEEREQAVLAALPELAELAVADEELDLAVRLLHKADALAPLYRNSARIRQIRLDKRLQASPERLWTDNFEIVYPRATGQQYPEELGLVLEEELRRLGRWIPHRRDLRHLVNLYPLEDFLEAYSGGALILGLYDGRVRVPLADLRSLHPQIVSVLSHELAHAMITRATRDNAPKWFHEGLAQHVEMVPGRINPVPDLAREGRLLSFPMIEAVLDGFAEAKLLELAYGEAAWVVHYIEAEHGVSAIRGLIAAFAEGATTEQALASVLDMSVEELDRAAWSWCKNEAPLAWPTELRRYDLEHDQLVRRASAPAPKPTGGAAIAAWHRRYVAAVAPMKRSLAAVAPRLQAGEAPVSACRTLAERLDKVLEDSAVLAAPEPAIASLLRGAYEALRGSASACATGDLAGARGAMRRAERALGAAAKSLEPYGLQP